MVRFEDILDRIETYNPQTDQDLLRRAYVFSAREHLGQVRRSGEPYLVHPLNVAAILTDMKADDVSIVVGLLHDVLEDTLTTRDAIAQQFGSEVADLVEGLTKISKFSYVSREEEQAETFRKMILAMVSDVRVVLVKLADRLHNMRTLAVPAGGPAAGDLPRDHGHLRPDRQPPRAWASSRESSRTWRSGISSPWSTRGSSARSRRA